ncbi:MAG: LD-carboxypeptidase [Flavobacteriaceae bacterium]|jgi:muramoyltetrapeptide carboxypeptidase|nr:LD-carboxypeptidase [Flavobacteriaceae bacterium]MDG1962703.1 LD-carboxypeptidase [Flavobacteriaceae bacterium]
MRQPPYLSAGDTVAVVATARSVAHKDIQCAVDHLREWGFNVLVGQSIGAVHHQFAGPDHLRAQDLQWALDHPEIKAIWCARGGYGTVRIIDALDFSRFEQHPKWIIGYSDITVLHNHLHQMNWTSIHAQMPLQLETKSPLTASSIREVLTGQPYGIAYTNQSDYARSGNVEAMVVGGNLSILYSLLGSPSTINTEGKILFIEDLDEYLYHIDRMLVNLGRNGMFAGLAGLIIGGFTDMKDHKIPFGAEAFDLIWSAVAAHDFPVSFGMPAGHLQDNQALPLGVPCTLEVTPQSTSLAFRGHGQS